MAERESRKTSERLRRKLARINDEIVLLGTRKRRADQLALRAAPASLGR